MPGRAVLYLRILTMAACALAGGCRQAAQEKTEQTNVVIITIDTLRADRLGCYGFALARTPQIDALAEQGVRCTNAITTAPITLPAHTSILTGLYPPAHGVRDNGAYALGDDVVTLAERLKDAGYATQAFVSALVLNRRYNLTQGFDGYDDDLWAEGAAPMFMIRDRPAHKTAARAVTWLEHWGQETQRRPFFVWIHFFDPHHPYEARVPNRYLLPTSYDAEIAAADQGVGMVIDALKRLGTLDETLVIMTADHGESLGEHKEKTHGIFIYDATVLVPLILRCPSLLPQGKVYEGPVRVVDIVPTILGALDLPGKEQTQGVDLLPAFAGKVEPPELPQYSESLLCEVGFGMAPLYGVRLAGHKWIRAPKPEVYNLRDDPKELHNIYEDQPEISRRLDGELEAILSDSRGRATAVKENPMDRETLEMLYSLGYLAPRQERESMGGMDPKDGIELHTKLEQARHRARRGDWSGSEPLLREILEVTPRNISARNVLALASLRQGKLDQAEREYLASLEIDPRQHRIESMLGFIHLRKGNADEAQRRYRRALELAPRFVEAMVHLGFLEMQRGNQEEAEQWYQKALVEDPHFPRAHHRYADLYFLRSEYSKALSYYKKALKILPNHFDALVQAGLCSQRTGDHKAAADYFRRAERLRPDSWIPTYDLACLEALAGNHQAALSLLDLAAEKGLQDLRLLQTDEDLVSLRDLRGYQDIVAKVRAAATNRADD